MKNKVRLLLLFTAGFLYLAQVQPVYADSEVLNLSLGECIDRALKENLNLKSYHLGLRSYELSVVQTKSVFDPSFSINIGRSESESPTYFDYYKVSSIKSETSNLNLTFGQNLVTGADWGIGMYNALSESNIETKKNYTSYLGLQINQPILRGFGKKVNSSNIYLAQISSRTAVHNLEDQAISLIYEVQKEYWNLVYAIETLKVHEISLAHADSLLAYNEKGSELGILTESDVLEAKSALVTIQQEMLDQKNVIRTSEDVLRRLLNITSDEEWNLEIIPTDRPEIHSINIKSGEALTKAFEDRPDYKMAERELEQYEIYYALAKNSMLPSLNLNAGYRLNGSGETIDKDLRDLGDTDEYGWSLGLLLSYPIRNRDAKADYEKKQIDIKRARLNMEDLKGRIISEIRTSIRNTQISYEKIDVAKLSVELNELKLKIEEEKFRNQLSSSYYVLEFQKDLANARNLYNKALMDYSQAVNDFRRAQGTLLRDLNITIIPAIN